MTQFNLSHFLMIIGNSMRPKVFYIYCFAICLFLSLLVKVYRDNLYGIDVLLDILLGSSPSFLYLFGLISLVTLITWQSRTSSVLKNTLLLTLGALSYEVEQYWSSRVFDYYDLIATLLASFVFLLFHLERIILKKHTLVG